MTNRFVIMWDMYGLEYVGSVDEPLKKKMWAELKGEDHQGIHVPNLNHLTLRARFNTQRNYEIYLIDAQDEITADEITSMFDANPQIAANTIRRIGSRVYGEPLSESQKPVIT